ncbi:hypothetical protein NAT51_07905 [Flavobacterium amniphilum]|uniref:hypothetical protein n=1 Tax=Flavobacterium amniphilum TaxID=1834035 RepID=UPI00202A2924|nr:hypothetical protein [Flavobacterium amniphilum]MCL9805441.1 hypothetical protein [Flavobacterium amniphilum]
MKAIHIFFLLMCFSLFSQTKNTKALKFQGHLKGVFEIIEIDSSQSENKIRLKLIHLLNPKDFAEFDDSKSYYALVISKKEKTNSKKKIQGLQKLIIGREYYFDLHHIFFYKSLYPGPNTIPYAFNLDDKRIWEEADDYGLYTSENLFGLFYK